MLLTGGFWGMTCQIRFPTFQHLANTFVIFADAIHIKACANSKKMKKRAAKQEALWYEEALQKEITEDRKAHGKNY